LCKNNVYQYVGFRCDCPPGFSGSDCSLTVKDQCNPNPCKNNGKCIAEHNDSLHAIELQITQDHSARLNACR